MNQGEPATFLFDDSEKLSNTHGTEVSMESTSLDDHRSGSRRGLAERMAAVVGFGSLKINTGDARGEDLPSSSSSSPAIRSPYLMIPPGLSPTTLLDSPVFLSNMAQPSPTTGKLLFDGCDNARPISNSLVHAKGKHNATKYDSESFFLKPPSEPSPSNFLEIENKISVQLKNSTTEVKQEAITIPWRNQDDLMLSCQRNDSTFDQKAPNPTVGGEQSRPSLPSSLENPGDDSDDDLKGEFSSIGVDAPAEDGYRWRKYGQKQVKGYECPCSYFKCVHPDCPAKKKVERSPEGHVTKIVYKGVHNHHKPTNHRFPSATSHSFGGKQLDGSEPLNWAASQAGLEMYYPSSSMRTRDDTRLESAGTVLVDSPNVSCNEDEDDQVTPAGVTIGGGEEGDDTDSKRRKLDTGAPKIDAASRLGREPRVVVQTTSEVDILDDGYRWRKYGQKVVKRNPNPRSYYKCTYQGCSVRKHVERASNDLKSVITTYEGKHNHDVPPARNSGGHMNSGMSSASHPPHSGHLQRPPETVQDRDAAGTRFHLPSSGYASGTSQRGPSGLAIAGLGSVAPPVAMPAIPDVQAYLGHYSSAAESGFMVSRGELMKEQDLEAGLPPATNGTAAASAATAAAFRQMMSRLPLGPPL